MHHIRHTKLVRRTRRRPIISNKRFAAHVRYSSLTCVVSLPDCTASFWDLGHKFVEQYVTNGPKSIVLRGLCQSGFWFLQISLYLKMFLKEACIVSKPLVSWGCGESVNLPKFNIQEALSSRTKARYPFFTFVKSHPWLVHEWHTSCIYRLFLWVLLVWRTQNECSERG